MKSSLILEIILLQMLCGTEPYPTDIRAKKYKVDKHFLSKVQFITDKHINQFMLEIQDDFVHIMKNLPVPVEDADIEEMFEYADKNKDGKLSYKEFKVIQQKLEDNSRILNFQGDDQPPRAAICTKASHIRTWAESTSIQP
jgi:hypothetical protein